MKKGFLKTLLLSNFLILTVFVVGVGIVMSLQQSNIRKKVENSNYAFLSLIQNMFDEKLDSTKDILNNISFDTAVQNLVHQKPLPDNYNRYSTMEVQNKLRDYKTAYSYIDSIILYYPGSQLTLTDTSVYRSKDEFFQLSNYAYWDEQEYLDGLLSNVTYIKYAGAVNNKQGKSVFTVVRSIPTLNENQKMSYIIVNFYYDFMGQISENLKDLDKGTICIYDNHNNSILMLGNQKRINSIQDEKLTDLNQKAINTVRIEQEPYLVCQQVSDNTGFRYFFILPESSFIQSKPEALLIIVTLLCIVIGAVFSIFSAKYNAKPIMQISKMIQQKNLLKIDTSHYRNEVEFINCATSQALNEYLQIKNEYARQIPVLQSNVIENVMKGVLSMNQSVSEELLSMGIEFHYSQYTVIVLHIERKASQKVLQLNWLSMAIKNILFDLFSSNGLIYTCNLEIDKLGAILNTDYVVLKRKEEIQAMLDSMVQQFQEQYEVQLTILVSDSTSSAGEISSLYADAAEAIDYQLFHHPGKCVFHSDIQVYNQIYIFTNETKNLLITNVKSGNTAHVLELLNKIYEENLAKNLSPEIMKSLFIDLTSTLMKICYSLGINLESGYQEPFESPIEMIVKSSHCTHLKTRLSSLFEQITKEIHNRKKEESTTLIDQILRYLEKNYPDQSLSLNMVANAFNLNSSYLSSYFKKSTGENFINYVNYIRLQKARELLEETNYHIAGIAEMVGYSNSSIFINNFKKAYHVTPGNYRSQIK